MQASDSEQRPTGGEVTLLLGRLRGGDVAALNALVELVYPELHRIAAGRLRHERPDHTLQPTALVNELYVRLEGQHHLDLRDRVHFLSVAAGQMRRILADHARRRNAAKRGSAGAKVTLTDNLGAAAREEFDLATIVALDEALDQLRRLSPRQASIAEMRYFAGLEESEIAEVVGISEATVKRDWRAAKAFLRRALTESHK